MGLHIKLYYIILSYIVLYSILFYYISVLIFSIVLYYIKLYYNISCYNIFCCIMVYNILCLRTKWPLKDVMVHIPYWDYSRIWCVAPRRFYGPYIRVGL